MKRFTFISIISLLIPLLGMSQSNTVVNDDVYYKPGDVNEQVSKQTQDTKETPNYKNGAKEIKYIERDNSTTKPVHDTLYVVGEANDSTENNQEQGYYLNGFKGSESDREYAERIRRFHNPRYEIFIGDPRYNDIYFLNDYDWNVYIDGSYAYVTPTWTNPYWWNYNFSPYSYWNWGFGFNHWYSPYSFYSGLYGSPWGFDSFYGGFGYGGYGYGEFGYGGYPYYGYGNYYGYGGYGGYYGLGGGYNRNHQDADDRLRSGISSRSIGTGANLSRTATSSREASNQYTTISGSNNLSRSGNTIVAGGGNNIARSTSRTVSNGTGSVRSAYTTTRNLASGINGTSYTTSIRSTNLMINTRPRTTNYNSSNLNNSSSRSFINNSSTNSRSTSSTMSNSRNSSTNGNSARSSYSSGNNPSSNYYSGSSTRSSSPSYNNTPSYSSGSSGSSGSSSGGSGSSGSRSSGGGGGRR